MTNWPLLLLLAVALMKPGEEECLVLQAAHQALLKGSFTSERHFTLKLNGELKVREVTRLTYSDGELTRETLEKEVLDESLVLEEGEAEAALELPFDCHRLERVEEGLFELSHADGTERVLFVWARGNSVLRPSHWINNETKRFLWKKLYRARFLGHQFDDLGFVWQTIPKTTHEDAPGSTRRGESIPGVAPL